MKRNQNASGKKMSPDLRLKMKIALIKSTLGQSFFHVIHCLFKFVCYPYKLKLGHSLRDSMQFF